MVSVLLVVFFRLLSFSQFTPGNVVVLQVGNGTSPLANTGNQVILKEFSGAGILTFSVPISTTLNPLVIGGTAVSEGGLSLSPNGKYLVFAGYVSDLTFTSSLSGASAGAVNRGIGIVDVIGTYSRIATSAGFYSANSIRSATSDGNENYWAAGANAGANYFGNNTPAATIQTSITNTRNVIAFNSGLYFSTGSGTAGIYKVGQTFPSTAPQTCSLVMATAGSGTNTSSPFAFFFNNSQTICYVADDKTPINGGGIQKWIYTNGNWSLAYTLPTGAAYGARGVVADFSGTFPRVYATTSEGASNRFIAIKDVGATSTATTLATSNGGTIFRGMAFAPYCTSAKITSISVSPTVCATQPFTLSADFSGTGPLSYTWSGPGNYMSTLQNPVLSATVSGTYSLTVTSGCGADVITIPVLVNPLPSLGVNSSSCCAGGSVTLIASGANTYSWSNATNEFSIVVSPTLTSNYELTGTSPAGCSSTVTATVTVLDSLDVTVNSAALCRGDTATLSASGAVTYSWSSGASGSSIAVTPFITTPYVVEGFAPGCPAKTVVSHVTVHSLPAVTIPSLNSSYCLQDDPVTLQGQPAGGIFTGNAVTGSLFEPAALGTGSFELIYTFTDANACRNSDTVQISVELCTGMQQRNTKNELAIFPNPVGDRLTIRIDDPGIESTLYIINSMGIIVETLSATGTFVCIDATNYAPGAYVLFVHNGFYAHVAKFMKE